MGSLLDVIEGSTAQVDDLNQTIKESTDGADNTVECSEIEAAGIIRDDNGNEWQVPADNVEDLDDLHAPEPYSKDSLPAEFLDKFHIQGIPLARLQEFTHKGFVPVTNKEVKVPDAVLKMTGSTLDSYHMAGDMLLVKIPRVIYERRQRAKQAETKRRLRETEPTADMLKNAKDSGVISRVEMRHGVTAANPDTRTGIYADGDGRVKNG